MMRLATMLQASAVAALIALCLSYLGRWHFMFDNLSSFRVHFALLFLILTLALAVARLPLWAAAAAVGLVASGVAIVPWYSADGAMAEPGTAVHVMSSNVSPRNRDHDALSRLIKSQNPDVLGLVEITPPFLAALEPALEPYPYRLERAEDGFWGVALFSKRPLIKPRLVHFGANSPPAIAASVLIDGDVVEFILVHPYPPMTAELFDHRNTQLRELAAYVAGSSRPTVILGDLNTALWSPYYRDFVTTAGLRNARAGHGVTPTWPAIPFLGVPIDHILATPGVVADQFRVLPAIGSDHYPVSATVQLGGPRTASNGSVSVATMAADQPKGGGRPRE